ncbi:hypothetical protein CAEBREN_19886 [Caenorhabditis brenneri]|uniref:GSKIP domain-containing protein n=1 Tax=Caenorhabditis brenneri TaxID=135651 RepID=G0MZI1_CAEBE|nr:hypothetical protein CAEBREN_19886 [Caenorhabditis brenneri]
MYLFLFIFILSFCSQQSIIFFAASVFTRGCSNFRRTMTQANKDSSLSETTTPPTTPVNVKKSNHCDTCGCEPSKFSNATLEDEANNAVREHAYAVKTIAVSEMLPRTPQLLFINVTTTENHTHCIELTAKGWRVASNRNDCMNGDFRQLQIHTKYFDSLHSLLQEISPSFRKKFFGSIVDKLEDVKKERNESE